MGHYLDALGGRYFVVTAADSFPIMIPWPCSLSHNTTRAPSALRNWHFAAQGLLKTNETRNGRHIKVNGGQAAYRLARNGAIVERGAPVSLITALNIGQTVPFAFRVWRDYGYIGDTSKQTEPSGKARDCLWEGNGDGNTNAIIPRPNREVRTSVGATLEVPPLKAGNQTGT